MSDSLRHNKLNQSHPGIWAVSGTHYLLLLWTSFFIINSQQGFPLIYYTCKPFLWGCFSSFSSPSSLHCQKYESLRCKRETSTIWNYIDAYLMVESINSHTMEPCLFSHRITSASPLSFQRFSLAALRQPCFMCLLFGKQQIPNHRHLPSAWFRDVKGPLAVASTGTWLGENMPDMFSSVP